MERNQANIANTALQWALFLTTNIFFVCKYVPRAGMNPVLFSVLFVLGATGLLALYRHTIRPHITERTARTLSILTITGIVVCIGLSIWLIDPMTLRVDRWSATSYFLDALFDGQYPYGVYTHRGEGNFPSPFPLWHYINIPFWLIGDVGWIQAFFLLLFAGAIYYSFRSWKILLSVLLLLCISPAYWWEIIARSDGLSNALLVCSVILVIEYLPVKMSDKWWFLAIISGCIASTRMSAIIPMALYLFRPWLEVSWPKKVGFVGIALCVAVLFFLPYILWDTETWVFLERNPFMSQSSTGNIWILLAMVSIALVVAYHKQTFSYYLRTTSVFMFGFMLVSQLAVIWFSEVVDINLFHKCCDISYFTLAMPYTLLALIIPTHEHD